MNKLRHSPSTTRDEFLTKLEEQCHLRFEQPVVEAMLAEVEAHLDESIQARLELGEAPEIAELNAVADFDQPHVFARSMVSVHRDRTTHDHPLFLFGLGFILWLGLAIQISETKIDVRLWMFGLLAFAGAFFIRSILVCSERWATMRRLLIAGIIVIGVIQPLLTINVSAYGGYGYMPLGMAHAVLRDGERSPAPSANSFGSYAADDWQRAQVGPVKEALSAPILERYEADAQETLPMFSFCFAFIFVAHFLPVAIRRRWHLITLPRRGSTA
jgi:hypothetical protein